MVNLFLSLVYTWSHIKLSFMFGSIYKNSSHREKLIFSGSSKPYNHINHKYLQYFSEVMKYWCLENRISITQFNIQANQLFFFKLSRLSFFLFDLFHYYSFLMKLITYACAIYTVIYLNMYYIHKTHKFYSRLLELSLEKRCIETRIHCFTNKNYISSF